MVQRYDRTAGRTAWSCPSNIAIVKYWGKRPVQLPMNPSLSISLEHCRTETSVAFSYEPGRTEPRIRFRLEGMARPDFEARIQTYTSSLLKELPLLAGCSLEIDSRNSFPHSSGIASSASAMGALALCYLELSMIIEGERITQPDPGRASRLARLGSGSAARSLFPGIALWGSSDAWPGSSDEMAIELKGFHPAFEKAHDSILLISTEKKAVSSSEGHRIMEAHPYASSRYRQATANASRLRGILRDGDWPGFIAVMEEEALSLHGLMMSGRPSYLLMRPGSLAVIEKLKAFRADTGLHLGFTLDAGANVHLIYDRTHRHQVMDFIDRDLVQYCKNGQVIHDNMGKGPLRTG